MIVKLSVQEACELPSHDIQGFDIIAQPTGIIYLDVGMVYDCTVLTEQYIMFEDGLNDVALYAPDLHRLVRDGKITITS